MKEIGIHESQGIVGQWCAYMNTIVEQNPDLLRAKLQEEASEAIVETDKQKLEGEIGDVLFTALSLANAYGIDANQALNNVFNKVFSRINPDIIKQLSDEGYQGMDLYNEAKRRKNGF